MSGLLKEYVDLYHPEESQPSDVTMLHEAVDAWKGYDASWEQYRYSRGEERVEPVLLVQVQDARRRSSSPSATDLETVVSTLAKLISHDADDASWLAHSFQDDSSLIVAGHTIRRIAPSSIDADARVKVVLFKTSLNTGWDCPRAETMVSFRTARDETNIAQLVGRMVRAPLARRIDDNEHLNTVALFLPFYDRATVEKVVARLTDDPNNVPPTRVRDARTAHTLGKALGKEECFKVLSSLPTYVIPRSRPMKPVPRLAKLAALLGELGLEQDAVKFYRSELVKILIDEHTRLSDNADFKKLCDENAVLDIRRQRVAYAAREGGGKAPSLRSKVRIADQNIDDLYAAAGKLLGEGLHKEYLRARRRDAEKDSLFDSFDIKLELHALVSTDGVLDSVSHTAERLRKTWTQKHKAAILDADEKHRQMWRDLEGAGTDPALASIVPPTSIEAYKATAIWRDHLYVEADGSYREDFKSSWEGKALTKELSSSEVIGWLRNQDRKPWSLCVKRRDKTKWVGIYPDFLIFRRAARGVIADIVDPHLLNDQDAPDRARALAIYAADHSDSFGRIELLIYENNRDTAGRRLDLIDESTRKKVAGVTTHEHLRQLFDSL